MREGKRKLTKWKVKKMKTPPLKIECIDGLQVIHCLKEDLDWESGKSLSICIPDFRGQKGDPDRCVIHIEYYDGRLSVRMYDGGEDSKLSAVDIGACSLSVTPDPVLTEAIYCPIENVPKLLNSEDEDVKEIVERRLKEGK
jgi:hypothetical protein